MAPERQSLVRALQQKTHACAEGIVESVVADSHGVILASRSFLIR
jgi:hypothetical protein